MPLPPFPPSDPQQQRQSRINAVRGWNAKPIQLPTGDVDPFSRPVGPAEAARVDQVFPRPGGPPPQQNIQPLLQILSQMAGPAMQGMENFQNQAQQMEQERQRWQQQQQQQQAGQADPFFGQSDPDPALEQQRLGQQALDNHIRAIRDAERRQQQQQFQQQR